VVECNTIDLENVHWTKEGLVSMTRGRILLNELSEIKDERQKETPLMLFKNEGSETQEKG